MDACCLNRTDIVHMSLFYNNIQVQLGSLILEFIRKLLLTISS